MVSVRSPWASRLGALADLVWPVVCGGCQVTGSRWCPTCAGALDRAPVRTSPVPCPPDLPPAWAVAPYGGVVREAIVAWKDHGRHDLTGPLAEALTRVVLAVLEAGERPGPGVLVVPMPSRRPARRARGGDPVRDLANRAAASARRAGWPVQVAPALRHVRSVADQSGLGAAARAANLAGALQVRPGWRPAVWSARCLLVDDIVTTGATVAEAARTLTAAGGHPFGLAVIAATQRTAHPQVTNFQEEG